MLGPGHKRTVAARRLGLNRGKERQHLCGGQEGPAAKRNANQAPVLSLCFDAAG